jgi:hypothetical protein
MLAGGDQREPPELRNHHHQEPRQRRPNANQSPLTRLNINDIQFRGLPSVAPRLTSNAAFAAKKCYHDQFFNQKSSKV